MGLDVQLLLRIERAGVNAWPALETADLQGWLWRYSDGGSQRANSVSALAFRGTNLETAIDEAERRYASRGVKTMFQVSDVAAPSNLDKRLEARGYRINDPCITLVKSIEAAAAVDGVTCDATVTPDWFECYASVITPERRRIAPQILERVPKDAAFCALRRGGRIVATALAVPTGDIVIAECVATVADARGTGAASSVMRGLEAWAAQRGCRTAALQALAHNAPAQALYSRLGYRARGGYHLRVKG